DCGIVKGEQQGEALKKLDAFLCELKDLQIRDGLHVFGDSPAGERLDELLLAIARARRGSAPHDESLIRALAADLGIGDPLALDPADLWTGPKPAVLAAATLARGSGEGLAWRTVADTIERLEALALRLISGDAKPQPEWEQTGAVLGWIEHVLRPAVAACGEAEVAGIIAGLDGRFVMPGPSGAPSRGHPDVLPTGRNFYSVDTRAVPTAAAWQLGWHSASLVVERYAQEH